MSQADIYFLRLGQKFLSGIENLFSRKKIVSRHMDGALVPKNISWYHNGTPEPFSFKIVMITKQICMIMPDQQFLLCM